MKDTTDSYICDECGNVSPVFNDNCPSCGAPMKMLDGDEARKEPKSDDEAGDDLNSDGTESLESLREDEEKDEQPDTYGDE